MVLDNAPACLGSAHKSVAIAVRSVTSPSRCRSPSPPISLGALQSFVAAPPHEYFVCRFLCSCVAAVAALSGWLCADGPVSTGLSEIAITGAETLSEAMFPRFLPYWCVSPCLHPAALSAACSTVAHHLGLNKLSFRSARPPFGSLASHPVVVLACAVAGFTLTLSLRALVAALVPAETVCVQFLRVFSFQVASLSSVSVTLRRDLIILFEK